jgi:hypothetical protein
MGLADLDSLGLEDQSGQMFTSEALPVDLSITRFSKRYFHLMWGITGHQFASFSIDEILKLARYPAITSVIAEDNEVLTLTILLRPATGSHRQKTVLQRTSELRDGLEWSPVTTFEPSEISVDYQVPIATGGNAFYRVLMTAE